MAIIFALVSFFLPWVGGIWRVEQKRMHNGFGFYTGIMGIVAFLLLFYSLLIILVPVFCKKTLVRKDRRETVRLISIASAAGLVVSVLTVIIKATARDFSGMEAQFGIYLTLIGCAVALFYSWLRYQEFRRAQIRELFKHPDDVFSPESKNMKKEELEPPPPPPPPKPPKIEEHRIYN